MTDEEKEFVDYVSGMNEDEQKEYEKLLISFLLESEEKRFACPAQAP